MYTNVQTVTSTLSISSRTASCKSYVKGISGTTKILVIQKLQKKSGNSWATVQTWSKTFDSIVASVTNTKSSLASGTYRIRTTAKVYCGSNYETINVNSATKTFTEGKGTYKLNFSTNDFSANINGNVKK